MTRKRPYGAVVWLLALAFVLSGSGLVLLALHPEIDLAVARLFLSGEPPHFQGADPLLRQMRTVARVLPFALIAARLAWVFFYQRPAFARQAAFLLLSLALGPGLLVNTVMKDHIHRPRPVHVADFGGETSFVPAFRIEGGCAKNCAFPSGETAAAVWTLAPALLLLPPLRLPAVVLALGFGAVTGLLRMAAGAHFLSDVLASAALMIGLIAALWFLLRPDSPQDLTGDGLRPKQASL